MTREMKDTGINWLGVIPIEWKVIAFWQAIERMGTGLNPRDNFELTKDDALYYVTIRNFKDGKLFLDDNCDRINQKAWEVIQARSDLQIGDILFASISKDGQAYILAANPSNWNINESVFCIRVNKKYYYDKYFYYHLINKGYYDDLRLDATGSTFQSIKQNKLRKSRLVLPPVEEQKRIVSFLDRRCAEIDKTIADTEKTIEEYKKFKKSIISQAVTKGIHSDCHMKETGQFWIGSIPEHWNLMRIKNIILPTKDGIKIGPFGSALTNKTRDNGDFYVYSQANLISADFSSTKNTIDVETFEELQGYEVYPDDICLSMMGTIGKCKKVPHGIKRGIMDSHLIKIRLRDCIDSRFFEYSYDKDLGGVCFQQMQFDKKGFIMDGLNTSIVKNLYCPVPPLEEQQEIVEYLDKKCVEMDRLIQNKHQLLLELEKLEKSLIYEYVTGKKEVPVCQ